MVTLKPSLPTVLNIAVICPSQTHTQLQSLTGLSVLFPETVRQSLRQPVLTDSSLGPVEDLALIEYADFCHMRFKA